MEPYQSDFKISKDCEHITVTSKCPKCGTRNEYVMAISSMKVGRRITICCGENNEAHGCNHVYGATVTSVVVVSE